MDETSLTPMESVEDITGAVQLGGAKAKVKHTLLCRYGLGTMKALRLSNLQMFLFRLKSLWLPRLREERITERW